MARVQGLKQLTAEMSEMLNVMAYICQEASGLLFDVKFNL